MLEDVQDLEDLLVANDLDRTRYLKKMEVFHHAAKVRRSKEPLRFVPIEDHPRCPHCRNRFATPGDVSIHLFGGCDREPAKKPIVLCRKRAKRVRKDNENGVK
jgi:hypothetical protein